MTSLFKDVLINDDVWHIRMGKWDIGLTAKETVSDRAAWYMAFWIAPSSNIPFQKMWQFWEGGAVIQCMLTPSDTHILL